MPNSFVNYANAEDLMTAIGNKFKLYKGAKIFKGSIQFSEIPQNLHEGDTYNITNDFTTDSRFVSGAGEKYPGGTDISVVNVGTEQSPVLKLDTSSGFIDVDAIEGTIDGMINAFTDDVFDPTDPPHEGDVVQYEGHVYTITTDYPTPEPGQEVPWDPNKATPYKAVTKIKDVEPEPASDSDMDEWLDILDPKVTPLDYYKPRITNGEFDSEDASLSLNWQIDHNSTRLTWVEDEIVIQEKDGSIWGEEIVLDASDHPVKNEFAVTPCVIEKRNVSYIWTSKQWKRTPGNVNFNPNGSAQNTYGTRIWTDGEHTYTLSGSNYVLNEETGKWDSYPLYDTSDNVINNATGGLAEGNDIYMDSNGDVYYSSYDAYNNVDSNWKLNKSTGKWSKIYRTGGPSHVYGSHIWSYSGKIYYLSTDSGTNMVEGHYSVNIGSSSWSSLSSSWNYINAPDIWTDGTDIYCSVYVNGVSRGYNYKLIDNDGSLSWEQVNWTWPDGIKDNFSGRHVWNDLDGNTYYSAGNSHYKLNKDTKTWTTIEWSGLSQFRGNGIWTDGTNIYYSDQSNNYVLTEE